MLGNTLVTKQTGPAGKQVNRLYIEDGADIDRELYLSILVDRTVGRVAFVVSTEGGMDIEAVAHDTPEKIVTLAIDPEAGVTAADVAKLAEALKLSGDAAKDGETLFPLLYKAFVEKDMSLLEVNPLIVMKDGRLRVLDAKVSFDNNALFRHRTSSNCATRPRKTPRKSRRRSMTSPMSRSTATSAAWSTAPASPWRPWTSSSSTAPSRPTSSTSAAAPRRRRSPRPSRSSPPIRRSKGILVNIFGGIMKCDVIAEGVIAAVKEVGLKVPLVVRLEGTNVELGKKIINESGLNVISADDLDDAARSDPPSTNAARTGARARG